MRLRLGLTRVELLPCGSSSSSDDHIDCNRYNSTVPIVVVVIVIGGCRVDVGVDRMNRMNRINGINGINR